jgi:hypothetical protein
MIRPTATIHVTTMELVIGKPSGRAISTARCVNSWLSSAANAAQPHSAARTTARMLFTCADPSSVVMQTEDKAM